MPFYTGSSADGSDMREVRGMYVNPKNQEEWSNMPYDREQKAYDKIYEHCAKYHKTFRELYTQVKSGSKENLPRWARVWLINEFEKPVVEENVQTE